MAWYYNVRSTILRVKLLDGSSFGFPPRQDVFVKDHLISGEVQGYIDNKTLRYRGGVSISIGERLAEIEPQIKQMTAVSVVTIPMPSNDIQPIYDTLPHASSDDLLPVEVIEDSIIDDSEMIVELDEAKIDMKISK